MENELEQPSTVVTDTTPPSTPAQSSAPGKDEEDDAAFGAGFDQARGTSTSARPSEPKPKTAANEDPATEAVAPKGTAKPGEAPASEGKTEPPKDEWAGVNPKVREELEAMRAKLGGIAALDEQLRKLSGHIGGQASQLKALKDALAQATTSVVKERGDAAAPTPAEMKAAGESPTKWKQLREDYPDWAEAIDERLGGLEARLAKASPPVDTAKLKAELLGDVDTRISSAAVSAETKGRVMGYLDSKHGPSWEAEIKSPDFDKWIQTQPKEVVELCASPRVEDASKLIDKFRAAKKSAAERDERTSRLRRAAQPQGVAVTETTEDEDAAFSRGFAEARGT